VAIEISPTPGMSSDRVTPNEIEVEKAVLGAMLIENDSISIVVEALGDESAFYNSVHRKVYKAILTLYERGEPADQVTVSEELARNGALDSVGGAATIAALASEMATAVNAEYHAKIVLEAALRRRLIDSATQTVEESYQKTEDIREVIDRAEQRIFSIAEKELGKGVVALSSVLDETFEAIERAHQSSDQLTGATTGYDGLDELTGGFQRSDLIILAARPAMGKTALTLCFARNAAIKGRVPVLFFSLEMATHQLAQRLLVAEARVDLHKLRTGNLREEDWQRLGTWTGKLMEAPIFIDDTPSISIMEMRAKARRAKLEHNIGMIVIDYLQLMTVHGRVDSREQEIAQISRSLKALAKELDIPIVACAQLSRAVEQRPDKRPIMSDLRESGSIEQDADLVMFLYRPEVYRIEDEEGNTQEGVAEIIIGKHRNGPTGSVFLTFLGQYSRFENPELYRDPLEI
jgi:replicative DNA helicase